MRLLRSVGIALLCMTAVLPSLFAAGRMPKPVRLHTGLAAGVPSSTPGVTVFKGLPFAAPPVGELRWRAPQPAALWKGVRTANEFGAGCIQRVSGPFGPWSAEFISRAGMQGGSSEDCLYLNVWTGARSPKEKRPVLVWIHGGGFNSGSGDVPVYDGEGLAAQRLVVVTINYRFGLFGFLAHPELSAESGKHASGNYGILDAIAALEWVRRNIQAFGGDPGNVTIAGQSAGAFLVHYLVASPLAKGLFHRAVAESGGAFLRSDNLAAAEQAGAKWASARGASNLAALRGMSPEELAKTPVQTRPIIDGYVVPKEVFDIFEAAEQNHVPVLLGWNADEGGIPAKPLNAEAFREMAAKQYGDLAGEFLRAFPAGDDEQALASQRAVGRAQTFAWPGRTWARLQARAGRQKVFVYHFDRVPPGNEEQLRFGAFHSAEIAYALNTLVRWKRPWEEVDRRLSKQMSGYWVNFARTGDPNGEGLPVWPAYSESDEQCLRLGLRIEPMELPQMSELDFFDRFMERRRAAGQSGR
jgi:para-nitrobenzyl esterase